MLKNWRWRFNARYVRAATAQKAGLAHTDKLLEWIQNMRSIAEDVRLVYGDRLATLLQTTAADLADSINWVELRLVDPPRDPKRRAELMVTIDLWVWDQVVRDTIEGLVGSGRSTIPGKDAGRTITLTPAINELAARGLPHVRSDEALKMRVHRLKVRPGAEDDLIADVLTACRVGPYDETGRERWPAEESAS